MDRVAAENFLFVLRLSASAHILFSFFNYDILLMDSKHTIG